MQVLSVTEHLGSATRVTVWVHEEDEEKSIVSLFAHPSITAAAVVVLNRIKLAKLLPDWVQLTGQPLPPMAHIATIIFSDAPTSERGIDFYTRLLAQLMD